MATRDYTLVPTNNSRSTVVKWEGLLQGDDGRAVPHAQYNDKSAQVVGTFGGASVMIEGSNDEVNFTVLTDPQGNALSFSAAGIEMVTEAVRVVRPRVIGGNGTTSLAVHLFCKE